MSEPHNQDPAPWYIREIRVYGISGLVALATVAGIKIVYENSRSDLKEKDVVIQRQFDKATELTERNTKAFTDFTTTLQKNNEALNNLNQNLKRP